MNSEKPHVCLSRFKIWDFLHVQFLKWNIRAIRVDGLSECWTHYSCVIILTWVPLSSFAYEIALTTERTHFQSAATDSEAGLTLRQTPTYIKPRNLLHATVTPRWGSHLRLPEQRLQNHFLSLLSFLWTESSPKTNVENQSTNEFNKYGLSFYCVAGTAIGLGKRVRTKCSKFLAFIWTLI